MKLASAIKSSRFIWWLSLSIFLSGEALAYQCIPTTIIPGGEVAIMEVKAEYDGQNIDVSGKGFEIFPRQTCGYAQIVFVGANERILLWKDVPYQTSYSFALGRRVSLMQGRTVSFFVNVHAPTPEVTSVFVYHHSTRGCEHSWSLQYALDWLIYKINQFRR